MERMVAIMINMYRMCRPRPAKKKYRSLKDKIVYIKRLMQAKAKKSVSGT